MFTYRDLLDWRFQQDVSESPYQVIETIHEFPPARRVWGQRGNVSGGYPSRKLSFCRAVREPYGRVVGHLLDGTPRQGADFL